MRGEVKVRFPLRARNPRIPAASRRGDLRIALPWEDNERRISPTIGSLRHWRIGVRRSLGRFRNRRSLLKTEP
jgi:hypothetical protein